ncbi:MAG: helix-turn-helix domain-containing protein [Chloroflexota bacterium]|nr:helix-turn-helix domain-containing protein [Chloroflexota bacterium]
MPRYGTGGLTVGPAQRAEVDQWLRRRNLPPRLRERLEMVKAVALGQELPHVAQWSGRTERTVRRWLGRFATGGVAALADAPRAGRPAEADAVYRRAAEAALGTPPRRLGLGFDVWTSARLSAYLADTTGVRIAPGWLRALLRRWDYVCGRPKHTLKHLQDAAAVAACEEELAAAASKSGRRTRAVRVPS